MRSYSKVLKFHHCFDCQSREAVDPMNFSLKYLNLCRCLVESWRRSVHLSSVTEARKLVIDFPTCDEQSLTARKKYRLSNSVQSKGFFSRITWNEVCGIVYQSLKPFRVIIPRELLKRMDRLNRRDFDPPSAVRGMKTLDKTQFKTSAKILSVRVPVMKISKFSKQMKNTLLKILRVKPIADLPEDDCDKPSFKLALFDPEKYTTVNDFSEEERSVFARLGIDMGSFEQVEIDLGYENWNAADILRAILPVNNDTVSGFTAIGHIAHLNLKDDLLDYKYLIGEILLDKTKTVTTVVNKLNTIDNTFRNFQMELLAGEENYVTLTKENACTFELDFSKVYWNSRLGTEHKRIVDLCPEEAVIYDVFAGIGPFTVPLAKKGCRVLANDLNPESFKWLNKNVNINKHKGSVKTHNLDGRDFIKTVVKEDLIKRWKAAVTDKSVSESFIIMNLPALAVEFLDAFLDIGQEALPDLDIDSEFVKLPQIFCYCFTKCENAEADIRERLISSMGDHSELNFTLFFVRNVAPSKDMYRVSFTLPKSAVFWNFHSESLGTSDVTDELPVQKKQKMS